MSRIMVVDDEPDMVFLLKTMLTSNGYDVVEACSGEECLQKLEADKFDLILLDIVMPGMNGWEVVEKIRGDEETDAPKIVMISARMRTGNGMKLPRGITYIEKPFDTEEMLWTVERLIKG